ncbi:MAG: glycerophosphodiester phosphodiesterase [Acidobacteriaceae bacterium]
MTSSRPLLLGHRGAKYYAPENTREAFELALDHGCDGFEFDVRLALGGEAVCFHDPDCGGRPVSDCAVKDLGVPSFSDVLGNANAFLDIDVKDLNLVPRYAQQLRLLDPERTVISSFLPQVLAEAALFVPNIPAGLICANADQLSAFESCGADLLVAHHRILTRDLVRRTHRAGKRVFVWTVNEAARMCHFASLGVDAIISDDTKLLACTLGQFAASA